MTCSSSRELSKYPSCAVLIFEALWITPTLLFFSDVFHLLPDLQMKLEKQLVPPRAKNYTYIVSRWQRSHRTLGRVT